MALFPQTPLVFGPSAPKPLAKPRIIVETIEVERAFQAVVPELKRQVEDGLNGVMKTLLVEVNRRTPVQTGDLKQSNRKKEAKATKTRVMAEFRSGGVRGPARGKTVNYARDVHEKGSPLGRGRGFVIEPALEVGEGLLPRMVQRAVERAVEKTKGPRKF